MKHLWLLLRVSALMLAVMMAASCAAPRNDVEGLTVVITSGDAQTQMMALVLSSQTVSKGKKVEILLCGPAGDLALRDAAEMRLKPGNKSPRMLLKKLIDRGVPVQVCALYLPNREKTAEDLIENVTPAEPSAAADALLVPGMKLFTF